MLITPALPPAHGIKPVHMGRRAFSRVLQQPVANYVGDSVFLDPMDDDTEWTGYDCTISYDTTHYKSGDANFQALKVTPDGDNDTNRINRILDPVVDLSGTHGIFRIYIPEGAGNSAYTGIYSINITLYDSTLKHRGYKLWNKPPSGYHGWYELNWLPNEQDYESTPPADLTDIYKIDIDLKTSSSTYTPEVVYDHLEFYNPKNTKGFVLVRMDGPYLRAWQGCAYMMAQKLTGTSRKLRASLCISKFIGAAHLLTVAQVHDLQRAGHFLMMYMNDWYTMAQADKLAHLDNMQEQMSENGFGSAIRYVAHAGAANWTYEDRTEIAPVRFDAVFGGNDEYANAHSRGLWNPRWSQWAHFLGNEGLAVRISRAAASKGLLIYGAHCADDAELTQFKTDIDLIVTEINNGTLIPVTFHELISGAGLVV